MGEALSAAREGLKRTEAWLVGGAVRDRIAGRETEDVDIAVAGEAEDSARAVARAAGAASFPLSEAFGACGWSGGLQRGR